MSSSRFRLVFAKRGAMRWISHRDLLRVFERTLRRAGLPLAMSQGFHPKPKMSFPSALALGVESEMEFMDFSLAADRDCEAVRRLLDAELPAGVDVVELEELPSSAPKLRISHVTYRVVLPSSVAMDIERAVERLNASDQALVPGKVAGSHVDAKLGLADLRVVDGEIWFEQWVNDAIGVGPREVLKALGLPNLEREGGKIVRTSAGARCQAEFAAPGEAD